MRIEGISLDVLFKAQHVSAHIIVWRRGVQVRFASKRDGEVAGHSAPFQVIRPVEVSVVMLK